MDPGQMHIRKQDDVQQFLFLACSCSKEDETGKKTALPVFFTSQDPHQLLVSRKAFDSD